MSTSSPRQLLATARAAAKAFQRPAEPLGWTAALAAAPWPRDAPPAWEAQFRRTFAGALVKRGIAKPAARPGAPVKRTAPSAPTKLMRRLLSATPGEFEEQDGRAEAAGVSWSTWARRRLARDD